jgi:mevalonate kinase
MPDQASTLSRKFSSKLLLFGEYSVLYGSQACAFPYPSYGGQLTSGTVSVNPGEEETSSNQSLRQLWEYLSSGSYRESISEFLDLDRFRQNIDEGMWFMSDIPANYGLGSSGALVAAVFDTFGLKSAQKDLAGLREQLAAIESCFHSKSSGTDPLVSYLNQPVFISPDGIAAMDTDLASLGNIIRVDLIDSGVPGETKTGVSGFENKFLQTPESRKKFESEYIPLVNGIINKIKHGIRTGIFEDCLQLTRYQTALFPQLFTPDTLDLSKKGIAAGTEAIKLCGSGGGGYYIRIRPVDGH